MRAVLVKRKTDIIEVLDLSAGWEEYADAVIEVDENLLNEYMDIQRRYRNMQQLLRAEVE